jgi:methylated-DNA-[protein]-cysteine S-methyltransferase
MEFKTNPVVYWTSLVHDEWQLNLAATAKGLCYVGSQKTFFEHMDHWMKRYGHDYILLQDDKRMQSYSAQLVEYLKNERTEFTLSLDPRGTPFQHSVWKALLEIPHGQTKSYTDIANAIQKPSSVRAVGTAIGANPLLIIVPCHRVIGKKGSLTGFRGGLDMKARLLQMESENTYIL